MDDFLNAINAFKTGAYDKSTLIKQFVELSGSNKYLSEQTITEIESLINSSKLPLDLVEQLSNIVTNQKTRIFIPSTDSAPFNTESNTSDHKSYSSSLLNVLLQGEKSDQNNELKADQSIRGTYRLVSKIGQGGMGEVWKAIDLIQDAGDSQDKYVAIKFLNQEVRNHPDALKALVREFARYKKLIHPNIVRAYEINRDGNEIFIVMEFLNGVSLKEFIQQHPKGISLAEAKPIIGGMCKALNYAHNEGIIHLDFKPGNVFYDEKNHTAKVIDFGIARLSNKDERDKTRFDPGILGAISTAYASTEMLLMDEDPDPRDDVYGLACISYELLSGKHAFNRTSALKAEREKMIPRPIKGIKDSEYQALLKGLNFNRKNRTSIPEQFFQNLYKPHKSPRKKYTPWLIIASILILAAILTPTIFKKAYDTWNNDQIVNEMNENQTIGINKFLELSADKQQELLLDDSAKLALVHYVINAYENKLEAIDFLSNLNPETQNLLFNNPEVSKLLISQCIDNIDQALITDDIDQALALTSKIIDKYPKSKLLSEKLETVINWKENRLSVLENTFYQCINNTSKSLLYLTPCFQETYEHLNKLSPQRKQLYSPELSERYSSEILNSIKSDDFTIAEKLLTSWHNIVPAKNNKRQELTRILKTKTRSFKLSERIINGTEMESVITELLVLDIKLKKEILGHSGIQNKLIDYFMHNVSAELKSGNYSGAVKRYDIAYNLLSDIKNGNNAVLLLNNQIQQYKYQYLKDLEKKYSNILTSDNPDVIELKAVIDAAELVDINNVLAQYPDIKDVFSKKTSNAISNQQFELALELIQSWKTIKPGDTSSKEWVKLNNRLNKQLENHKNRIRIEENIKYAINSGQLADVQKILKELQAKYSNEEKQRVLLTIEKQLTTFYEEQIQYAIKQDTFSSAYKIANEGLTLFPKSEPLTRIKNDIKKEKNNRITNLLTAFRDSLYSETSNGKEVFSNLSKIRTIDKNYLDKDPDIYKTLETRLLDLADNEDSFSKLQDLILEWDKFFNTGKNSSTTTKNYQKSKNLIALRCLYTGQRLKNTNSIELSNEFIMFGLTLNPIKTVKRALEKELLR